VCTAYKFDDTAMTMTGAGWAFAAVVGVAVAVGVQQWQNDADLLTTVTFFETLYHTYVSTAGQEAFVNRTLLVCGSE